MKKITLKLTLVLLIMAVVLTGCSTPQGSGTDQTPTTPQGSTDSDKGPSDTEKTVIRFSWWGGDARHQATLENIARYESRNPHIKVEPEYGAYGGYLEKLYVQLASKTVPDIPAIDGKWVHDMMRNYGDEFINLRDLPIDLSGFDEEFLVKVCGDENFTLGASMGTNSYGIIYNVEFFEKFNLPDPTHWDWEDYIEYGIKVQEQDPEAHLQYHILNNFGYIFKYRIKQKTGKDIVGEDYTLQFTVEDATEAWEYFLKLVETGTIPPLEESMPYATSYPDQVPKWLEGKYGMHITQASNLSSQITGSPFELKTSYLPLREGSVDVGFPVSSSQVLAVYAHGHVDEAAKFIDYLVNDEEAIMTTKDTRGIPSNQRAAAMLEEAGILMPQMIEFLDKYNEQGNTVENSVVVSAEILELTCEFAQQVGYKKMTPAEAAVAYMEELEKVVESLKQK
jgi:oligogalacturonide transport system substrate-binding protein